MVISWILLDILSNIYIVMVGCGAMTKVLDCGLEVREFKPQSWYYVHFQANTLRKGMNPLILQAMGWIISLLFFLKDGISIK